MKTKTLQTLLQYACIQVIFCLASASPSVGQYLTSRWLLSKPGKFDIVRNMDVSTNGEVIAVVEKVNDDFATVLYSKDNAQLWREVFTVSGDGIDMRRTPCGVEYSEGDGGVFVLASETTPSVQNGVIIKYRSDGTRAFVHTIRNQSYFPEVMNATEDGGVIVAGVAIDFSDRGSMWVEKYSDMGDLQWTETYSYGGGITVPKRMRRVGNDLYITGIATFNTVLGGYRLDRHPDSRMFTMKIDLSDRKRFWRMFKEEPRGNYYGYDMEASSNGVVVLGQSLVMTGIRTGNTIVVKYNNAGDEEWSKTLPSNYRTYGNIDRNVLEQHGPDEIYVAYSPPSSPEESAARIEKYDRYGNRIGLTDIRLDGATEIEALSINHANHDLFVALRIGTDPSDYHTKIQIYSADGSLIGEGAARDYQSIRQLELIDLPDPVSYPSGNRIFYTCGGIADIYCYIEKFEQNVFLSFPDGLDYFNNYSSHRSGRDRWAIDYFCESAPCSEIFMNALALADNKEIWKQEFNKPVVLTLPSNLKPDTYVLRAKINGEYRDLIQTDENLFVNGIKDLDMKTNTKAKSMTLTATTDGKQVPFDVTWYNKSSKVIRTESFIAPVTKEIKDLMSEPVAFIRFSAGSVPLEMSYYPNPSSGDFQLTVGDNTKLPAEVSIYDMNNSKVYQQAVGPDRQLSIKLSGQKPGLYVLLLKGAGGERRELIQIK